MFYKGNEDREKQLRFSIRKVSFGAASVAVAALYLFMGSGAVSAAEAQAVQSNEEVAADKDSEIEKKSEEQQPTYAAPAAKEQGSATNTEAGDEGKQESHPETKEEEANSSERSETTTKTQSDENSVSGDSSSPKSEGEGTRSEEASNKPKVRKRRDADPAPPATAADADSDANQVFEGASDDDSVEELARKLRALDDTVENNKKVSEELDSLGAATGVEKGDVQNINEFGGWTAITDSEGNGKFAIARKTDNGVFPLETINTVRNFKTGKSYTYLREQAIDRDADYMLFLSEVRTKASENEQTFNGKAYQNSGLGPTLSYGLKGYNGIQKTFKAYSPDSGSKVKITFKTGYSGDIDGTKAKYRVQVFTSESSTKPVYDVAFDPQNNTSNKDMIVLKASDGSRVTREFIEKPWTGTLDKQGLENQMAQAGYTPNGMAGRFTSREIELPAGVTDYTVKISSADNDHLGMGYQSSHRHYALPISGRDFHVTQNIGGVAKSLLQKIYTKLKESEEKDKNFKTPESQRRYEEALVEANQLLQQDTKSTTEYQTILQTLLEKRQELANSSQEASIKSNATDEIDKAAAAKIQAIEGNAKLSEADKAKAKE
ncbi:YSIRK-type signal peptide-containing protein, partial [Streptococcus sp. 1013]